MQNSRINTRTGIIWALFDCTVLHNVSRLINNLKEDREMLYPFFYFVPLVKWVLLLTFSVSQCFFIY